MIILKKIANFTQKLLQYDETKIIISRKNFDRHDASDNIIVIDNIFSKPIGKFIKYNSDTETQDLTTRFLGDFQILFYGNRALTNAILWQNMLASESKFTLECEHGIKVYNTSSHNNFMIEDGTTFDNLYQCDFKVKYDETTHISTLSIDVPVLRFTDGLVEININ